MTCTTNKIAASNLTAITARAIILGAVVDIRVRAFRFPTKVRSSPGVPQIHTAKNTGGEQRLTKIAVCDQLVLKHLPLVKIIALQVRHSLPAHVDLEDMVQAGSLGLLRAASKYDPKKQVAFPSYAKYRIKGAIIDSLRTLDWASRDMRRHHKQVETAKYDLFTTLRRTPLEAEVAEKLGMDLKRFRTLMVSLCGVGLVSASTRSSKGEDLPAPDFPDKPEDQPDRACACAELRSALSVAVKELPARYQSVVLMYYNDEMTMMEIGGVLGVKESRISQIHKAALAKMATVFEAVGITSSQAFFGSASHGPRRCVKELYP
jgi:RNA polymerase sigma factor FliA